MTITSFLRAPLAAGYLLGVLGAPERNDGRARIVMFHGTPRRFAGRLERILRYLKRHFEIVPLAELARDAASGSVRLRRQLALTFDDGLGNNVEVAHPILQRLGLPATFFVCPGLVEQGRWLWNHEARARLARMGMGADARELHVGRMKRMPLAERRQVQARIEAATPRFVPTVQERHEHDLASWEALRTLSAFVTLGSHTLTHPILPMLERAAMEHEVAASRRLLEDRLQRPVEAFAYPNGDMDGAVLECARRHYAIAVRADGGFVAPGTDPLALPRIPAAWNPLRLAIAVHREKTRQEATSGSRR